jgi:hypothetical protein
MDKINNMTLNKKIRATIPIKIRSVLQQEINSACPFCQNTEVAYFEVHHIDQDPSNNIISNLLLLCAICHSKITKDDIYRSEVESVKRRVSKMANIECAFISVNSNECSWEPFDDGSPNAFVDVHNNRSQLPMLVFSFINHSPRTILLNKIHLKAKHLYSGLNGFSIPRILKSIAKYRIRYFDASKVSVFELPNQIEVPSGQAFKFEIEVFRFWRDKEYPVEGRNVLNFTFCFNNNVSIQAPTVFLNCKNENEGVELSILS